jgi:SPP1 gp7 family putative phage head morphogenesis protein
MPEVRSSFVASPDQEAVNFLTSLPVLEREVWSELMPEMRAVSFTIKLTQQTDAAISKAEMLAVMERAKLLIATIPAGGDARKVEKQIAQMLSPYFPTPAQAARRATLLVRHWAGVARQAAWYRQLDRQRDLYPYWKYLTFGDDRVRDSHRALHGKIIPASSPFWDTHFPPWAPMCRCRVVGISQREYDEIKAREADLPFEQRTIIEGPQLEALEKSNSLITALRYPQKDGSVRFGPVTPISVAPEPNWNGWNPRDIRIGYDTLKERYKDAPNELTNLMKQADAREISPGLTLGDYIRGKGRLPAIPLVEHPRISFPAAMRREGMWPPPAKIEDAAPLKRVFERMKEENPRTHRTILTRTVPRDIPGAETIVKAIDDFLSFTPVAHVDRLPRIKLAIHDGLNPNNRNIQASYNAESTTLRLWLQSLGMHQNEELRKAIFHELAHWLYTLPGEAADQWRQRVANHWAEHIKKHDLIVGPRYDYYPGWISDYAGAVGGHELIPSYLELLSDPWAFAAAMRKVPADEFVETFKIVSSILAV